MSQLEKEIKSSEDLLVEKEDALEVADVDYSMSENLREDVVSVDRLHADCVVLKRRIRDLTEQVTGYPLMTSSKEGRQFSTVGHLDIVS